MFRVIKKIFNLIIISMLVFNCMNLIFASNIVQITNLYNNEDGVIELEVYSVPLSLKLQSGHYFDVNPYVIQLYPQYIETGSTHATNIDAFCPADSITWSLYGSRNTYYMGEWEGQYGPQITVLFPASEGELKYSQKDLSDGLATREEYQRWRYLGFSWQANKPFDDCELRYVRNESNGYMMLGKRLLNESSWDWSYNVICLNYDYPGIDHR